MAEQSEVPGALGWNTETAEGVSGLETGAVSAGCFKDCAEALRSQVCAWGLVTMRLDPGILASTTPHAHNYQG